MKPGFNKFAALESQREHALHQKRLKAMRPSLDIKPPRSLEFPHMHFNAKKKMAEECRPISPLCLRFLNLMPSFSLHMNMCSAK